MSEKEGTQTPVMWRSKLGTSYPKSYMDQNEARLMEELYSIRDAPENRTCADCGDRGSTIWASVNLGVFLCMACGAHHRSLGTHISLPKGCTGTYLWGPDEIERMRLLGNAHAQKIYGKSQPPNGVRIDDTSAWKNYLTDKYVHKKFAPTSEQRGDVSITPSTSLPSSPRVSPRLSQRSPKFSRAVMPDIDLIHFESSTPRSPCHKTSPRASIHVPTNKSPTINSADDFFAEFGL